MQDVDRPMPRPPIRLLRAVARLNVGGPSIQAITLTRFLRDRGYETRLLSGTPAPSEGSMDGLAEELGVRVSRVRTLRRSLGFGDAIALAALAREMRRWRPDILHTHASKAGALGRTAALLAGRGKPRVVVHTFHGHVLSGYFSPRVSTLFTAIERLLARTTTCLIAVSDEVRDDLVRLRVASADQIVVMPVGFDLSRFDVGGDERTRRRAAFRQALGVPLDALVVTLVARIERIKRVDRFLRIAQRLGVDSAHFLVVGDGELRHQLQTSGDARRLGSRLIWTGLRSDMPDVYVASDALVVTSDNEGTAASAIEAQAAGLPVVSTRVGGMPTVVVDGETGYLVDVDDEEAFADRLRLLLHDPELAERLGRRGAARARTRFSLDRLVSDLDGLYRRLLSEAARGSSPAPVDPEATVTAISEGRR